MDQPSLFEQLGGEPALRQIIARFVERVTNDVMIGFFFRNVDRARLEEKEYEFAAEHLGADVKYSGRPIRQAHAAHPIMGGQFMRRLQLLKETLAEHDAPAAVVEHWIEHTNALRSQVTRDTDGRCDPVAAVERVREQVPGRQRSFDEESEP